MTARLHDLQRVREASGAPVSACRAALDAAAGHVADAIDLLARQSKAASDVAHPFDGTDWFTGPPLTRTALHAAQQALGFRFPAAYTDLLLIRNGGSTRHGCFAVSRPTSWAPDHIAITGIRGIGGKHGIDIATERAIHADWGYPSWGFVFAETPTAGHTVVMFDYRACGPEGEPCVVWVDTYGDAPEVLPLAQDFTAFVAGLCDAEAFDGRG
ncbi:hypothetical protein HNP48_001664 [Acidovorax soli]|uniref:Knr4/Smi1-like domain-containing protein n=1 Tax=Acidovorax soli TaxID=592050 RepID=A0A7X0PBS5_9BURK|nr:SMI1/KNR4 family protein [Acidovorax soli]MBB6559000.1 hypothetical protein [Acidovorax soli]